MTMSPIESTSSHDPRRTNLAAATREQPASLRAFGSPQRYLQGPGALRELGGIVASFGATRPFVVADAVVQALLRADLEAALGPAARFAVFGGECSASEIDRLAAQARAADADIILGVGGGKAIDAAKGVRIQQPMPLVVVPSIASNDSPTSRIVVVYTDDHRLLEVRRMPTNPDVVLVDTAIIAAAPPRFFVSGIGDALSKKFEAAQCAGSGGQNFYGGRPPALAQAIADACYDVIREHAEPALMAVRRQRPDAHVEETVEATILLSGLAFENGGLSIAHSLTRGLSIVPGVADALHGEQVAWALLVQWVLEGRSDAFMADQLAFYGRIGLPRTLQELGLTGDPAQAATTIARDSWARAPYVKALTAPVDPERLEAAINATREFATAVRSPP